MQYISLLRGINVSGQKAIKMESLRNLCIQLGFTNVSTYIQSGNVVFDSPINNPKQISLELHNAILQTYSFDVSVFSYLIHDFRQIIEGNPFASDKDTSFQHVSFFSEIPTSIDTNFFDAQCRTSETIAWGNTNAYLYCPNGYGTSKLTNNLFEKKLKIDATTRNWKTCCELLKMAESLE